MGLDFMKPPPNSPWGVALLGRDIETWGRDNVGLVAIDPNICPEPDQCPQYNDHLSPDNDNETKIHMVIASFRDRLCPRTLYNAFHKAENPHRIYIRVLQQIDPTSSKVDDADCWQMFCEAYDGKDGTFDCNQFRNNVEIVSLDARIAKGPCDARSKLSALIEYDYRHATDGKHRLAPVAVTDYCLQTDSHMDFSTSFDRGLIEMFHRAENDRAVLSTYVAPMEQTDKDPKEVPHLCMIEWRSTWRNWGTKFLRRARKPKLTNLVWGAGMSFQKCHAELNVPYDPFLDNVFDGEETSRGIRFFTHGYDVYTPDKVLVTHDYHGHQGNPVVHSWGRNGLKDQNLADQKTGFDLLDSVDWSFMEHIESVRSNGVESLGTNRVNLLMGTQTNPNLDIAKTIQNSRYGLGTVRSLEQAYEFAGFDPIAHKMIHNHCGNIKWVPYKLLDSRNGNDDFGVGDTLGRRLWTEDPSIYKTTNDFAVDEHSVNLRGRDAEALSKQKDDGHVVTASVGMKERINDHRAYQSRLNGLIGVLILVLAFVLRRQGLFKPRKSEKSKV